MAEKNASGQKNTSPKIKKLGSVRRRTVPLQVTEQVPVWLRGLLGKYGEPQGMLIGLQEENDYRPPPVPAPPVSRTEPAADDELSSVLQQMAETGIPHDVGDRSSTSVEWGLPTAEHPQEAPIDNMLAGLNLGPDVYAAEPDDFEEPADWLSGIVVTDIGESARPDLSKIDESDSPNDDNVLPSSSSSETDIPDWLLDSLDEPVVVTDTPPASAPVPSPASDVPDWLSGAMDTPLVEFPFTTGSQGEVEIPAWLVDASDVSSVTPPDQPADISVTAASPRPSASGEKPVSDITDWDVPDWLSDDEPPPASNQDDEPATLIGSPFTDVPGSGVKGNNIPDWLRTASISVNDDEPLDLTDIGQKATPVPPPKTAGSSWDELRGQMTTGGSIPPATPSPPASEISTAPEVPDWLMDPNLLAAPPPTQASRPPQVPDWLTDAALPEIPAQAGGSPQPQAPDYPSDTFEIPDWLTEEPTAYSAPPPESPESQDFAAVPDWQLTQDVPRFGSVAPEDFEVTRDVPDWLSNLGGIQAAVEDPDLADNADEMPTRPYDPQPTGNDWLSNLRATVPDTLSEIDNEPELSDEGDESVQMDSSAGIALPDWLLETKLTPLAAKSDQPEDPPQEPEPFPVTESGESGTPDWLAEFPDDAFIVLDNLEDDDDEAVTFQPVEDSDDEEFPDWLAQFSDANSETMAEEEPQTGPSDEEYTSAWLAEIPSISNSDEAPSSLNLSTGEMPEDLSDWIASLPESPEVGELFGSEEVVLPEEAAQSIPDSAANAGEEEISGGPVWLEDEPVAESAIPDWVANLTEPATPPPPPPSPEIDEENGSLDTDLPDWLANLSELSPERAPQSLEPEAELPDWLSAIPDIVTPHDEETMPQDSAGVITGESPTRQELKGWLGELSAAEVSDEAVEIPEWMAEEVENSLPEFDVTVTNYAAMEAGLPDDEAVPDWLTSSSEQVPDMPPWLVESEEPEPGSPARELPNDELPDNFASQSDLPAWVVNLRGSAQQTAIDETDVEMSEAEEPDEEPGWEFGSAQGDDEESDLPDWLAEIPEMGQADESPEYVFEAEDDEESDLPDWLAEIPEAEQADDEFGFGAGAAAAGAGLAAAGHAFDEETGDEESDIPDWLAEVSGAVQAEEEPELGFGIEEEAAADEESDLPDWLAEIPEATAPPPTWLAAEPEAELADESPEYIFEASADEESDLPDWLAEIPEAEQTDDESGFGIGAAANRIFDEETGDEESDLPDWLAEIPEATDPPPTWLAAEPEAELADESPEYIFEAAADEESDLPDWLAEIPEAEQADDESGFGIGAAANRIFDGGDEAESDIPDWLAEVREVEDVPPDWLAEIPEAPHTGLLHRHPASEPDLSDMPDWLSDLPEAPHTGILSAQKIAEVESEESSPDFLAGIVLPDPVDEQADDEAGFGIDAAASRIFDEDTGDEESDLPDWLAEIAEAPHTGLLHRQPAVDEAAPEMPDWLADLPQAPNTGALSAHDMAEGEADEAATPDFLAGIVVPPPDEAQPEPDAGWDNEIPAAGEDSDQWAGIGAAGTASEGAIVENVPATDPDWLINLPKTTGKTAPLPPLPEDEWADDDMPDWLADIVGSSSESEGGEDEAIPDWFARAAEAEDELDDAAQSMTPLSSIDEESDFPDWLQGASVDDLGELDWLNEGMDETDQFVAPAGATVEDDSESFSAADWRTDIKTATGSYAKIDSAQFAAIPAPAESTGEESPDEADEAPEGTIMGLSPENEDDTPAESSSEVDDDGIATVAAVVAGTAAAATAGSGTVSSLDRMTNWLDAASPAEEVDTGAAETTGMLAGLSTLLPSEKVVIPTPRADSDADSLIQAATEFYQIATTPPLPSAIPEPLSRQERLAGRAVRAGLYLFFMLLMAIPLLPGAQKVVNKETGQLAPWTEPAREFSETLDSQRRQLISEQLGIIDLQPPGAVALVSFDYSASTQGEMQPLAEAVLGRLKGQGMRLIAVSLEPEGATLAQHTLEKIAADKGEVYGQNMVNLGYLPGQAAAVRQLATGANLLAELPDYTTGVTFADASRSNWSDVTDLGQVSMIVTLPDNPVTGRWWIEQLEVAAWRAENHFLLAASSAVAEPFLAPYRDSGQLNGLIAGINGAAAIEAGRQNFGPARQMIDSLSVAHLLVVILIALGTIVGWMPSDPPGPGIGKPDNDAATMPPDEGSVAA